MVPLKLLVNHNMQLFHNFQAMLNLVIVRFSQIHVFLPMLIPK